MSDAQKISGVMFKVLPKQSGSGKKGEWVKQDFVIGTSGQYPTNVVFQVWGDKISQIPETGTEVTVFYNPESREYGEKWYTDLKVWKIEVGSFAPKETKKDVKNETKPVVKTGLGLDTQETDDDLPF
jgi:hypothetical protein